MAVSLSVYHRRIVVSVFVVQCENIFRERLLCRKKMLGLISDDKVYC